MKEIRVIDAPSQIFSTRLNNTALKFHLKYNSVSDRWTFDLYINEVAVLHGRRIVTDTNLLAPFPEFDVGIIFAADPERAGNVPDRNNLPGGLVRLYQTTREEVEAAI